MVAIINDSSGEKLKILDSFFVFFREAKQRKTKTIGY